MRYGSLSFQFDGFDWDEFNTRKIRERLPLETVEGLFRTRLLIREDTRHSLSEERFIAMGEVNHRIVFVAYTIRKKGAEILIRVISARYVHSDSTEKEFYEKAKKILEEK